MADKVVDASAFAAVAFAEAHKLQVLSRLSGHRLIAPQRLRYEMASICLKKIRAQPHERLLILEAYRKSRSTHVDLRGVDGEDVVALAENTGLSSYDASYLWLAHELGAELVTLDERLQRAAIRLS